MKKSYSTAIDTETYKISYPDQVNPKMVVLSYYRSGIDTEGQLCLASDPRCEEILKEILQDSKFVIGANLAFDLHVIIRQFPSLEPLIYDRFQYSGFSDIQMRQRLLILSRDGRLQGHSVSLASLALRYLDIEVEGKGPDAWRMRYHELEGVPLDQWPEAASEYAKKDSEYTYKIWDMQKVYPTKGVCSIFGEALHTAADFVLRGASISGIKLDQERVKDLESSYGLLMNEVTTKLSSLGLLNEKGSRDTAKIRAVAKSIGIKETTPGGAVATDKVTLKKYKGRSPELDAVIAYSDIGKAVTTFIPQMMGFPRLHPRFNSLVSTLRTSCFSSNYYKHPNETYGKRVIKLRDPVPAINLQQIPRDPKFREPFVPEVGHVFIDADYQALELACFSQTCYKLFGYSDMREVINCGADCHDMTGSAIYSFTSGKETSAQEFRALVDSGSSSAKQARQIAKIINLGVPGGQGPQRIMESAKAYGLNPSMPEVYKWLDIAKTRYREFTDFFKWLRTKQERDFYNIDVAGYRLARRTFTEAANCMGMQTLGALGSKRALFLLDSATREKSHLLLGSQIKAFIHDEILLDTADIDLDKKMEAMAYLMLKGLSQYLPDVRVTCNLEVQDYWSKSATPGRPSSKYTFLDNTLNKLK